LPTYFFGQLFLAYRLIKRAILPLTVDRHMNALPSNPIQRAAIGSRWGEGHKIVRAYC